MELRHELKHYINLSDYFIITSRLKYIAKRDSFADENGLYKIRSIYFDDYNDKVLGEKIMGINNRDKFRIRFYNDNHNYIKLEKKSKINGMSKKLSTTITKEACEKILLGQIKFLGESTEPLFQELYLKMQSERQKPKTVVDYIREAYTYDSGNVRITFDKSVRTGLNGTRIFDAKMPTVETLDERYIILEVKYDAFLPEVIGDLIQVGERSRTSISKYALCRMYG
ncbi:MAG: polyphosphate polymerase domain-containing protein [Cellulosilyticaceae bacterium]